jgi:DNA-binding CsgD family transcriptional regulator
LLLRSNLEDIAGEFVTRVETAAGALSLREQQLCGMIRLGMSSKEIAESLNLSISTVHNHRERIRHKLGLQNTRTNLASYLQSL